MARATRRRKKSKPQKRDQIVKLRAEMRRMSEAINRLTARLNGAWPPLPRDASTRAKAVQPDLSSRALKILWCQLQGHSDTLIARNLGIKERVVGTYTASTMRKLGAKTREQVGAEVIRWQIFR
jgi:DNA-binding NarL/FixJ family response regulator